MMKILPIYNQKETFHNRTRTLPPYKDHSVDSTTGRLPSEIHHTEALRKGFADMPKPAMSSKGVAAEYHITLPQVIMWTAVGALILSFFSGDLRRIF